MNDGFDDDHDSLQGPGDTSSLGVELSAQQVEIHRNLKSIGPEIAAYYLDGIRILQNKDLETAASLLAHVAREIDGGLRDILSEDIKEELEFTISTPDDEVLQYKKKKKGDFAFDINRPGNVKIKYGPIEGKHKASILQSLGIDELSPLAERWIKITKDFTKYVHRRGAWKDPRRIEEFQGFWLEFEAILVDLVGSYLNLLDRLDRIRNAEPTRYNRGALHNLLKFEVRRTYFFTKLKRLSWLIPLKEDGWFDPKKNPSFEIDADSSETLFTPTWYALEYVEWVSHQSERPIDTLIEIVNSIINHTDDDGNRIENGRTDLQIIRIISTFPIEHIELQHIAFIDIPLKSEWKYGLLSQEIGEKILPKFLNANAVELTIALLKVILKVEVIDSKIVPLLDSHWLERVLKEHSQSIANLCGIEATQITLEQIRVIDREDPFAFNFMQLVESDISQLSVADYTELIVSFTSLLYQFAEPNNIKMAVKRLLNEPHTIIRRIGVNAINHHYDDLKDLFWNWEGNPLDEYELKPEMYQLIQTNSSNFDVDEMEQMLQWIESTQG